jgi:immune inhibitor A
LSPLAVSASPALAAPPSADAAVVDDLPNPLEAKRRDLREQAVSDVVNGKLTTEVRNGSTVAKVGTTNGGGATDRRLPAGKKSKDQYVELNREKTDRIFVILAEFGDQRSPNYPDQDTDPATAGPVRFDGPIHNQIPQPNRALDNSTVWRPDYNQAYFQDLYFGGGESLRNYYESQSSGRYSVNGEVTDWVKVPFNEARYGRSNGFPCGGSVCSNTWALIRDAANTWVTSQLAQGRTLAEVTADMKSFDVWDRYDFDGDGDFNEPDGYIDHFQIVHAGGDQADGDPIYGEDAIWSHRWYAFVSDQGLTGPAGNLLGGTQIGNTGLWIGDYTIQPENGGRSVFYHEYGHDLGLPDDYNILSGGDNNNEHWTLMAQSRLGARNDGGIGERGGDIGAWNKLQLGWLDYEVVAAGQSRTLTLGPAEFNSTKPQGVVVVLPDKQVTTDLGATFEGTKQYFSGNADDLNVTLSKQVNLAGKTSASLALKGRYGIEAGFDFLYVEASTDATNWTALDGTIGGVAFGHDGAGRPAIDGTSNGWVDLNVPLPAAYLTATTSLRLHYVSDGGVSEGGVFADAISVVADGAAISTDGAEGTPAWTAAGFSVVGTSITNAYDNFYIAAHRTYTSFDKYLETGPYFFGYATTKPDFVDHYAYQEGLLISYWDTSYTDNDTFAHPGNGRNLYIDAHPQPIYNLTGQPWRARVQVYDAPFGLARADSFTLHINGQANYIRGQAGQPLFDDTKPYWFAALPNHGVKLPAVGVKIKVLQVDGTSIKVKVS